MTLRRRVLAGLSAGSLSLALLGCPAGDVEPPPGPVVIGARAPGTAPGAAGTPGRVLAPFAPPPWHVPVGPSLLVIPGQGFGPVRFGAHLDTVERLIGEPCEEKKEEPSGAVVCRYSAQAIDFVLEGGGVTRMRAHRLGRLFRVEPKVEYGIFNGRFIGGAAVGMLQGAVREMLGPPRSVHEVKEENLFGTVEVDEYEGFSVEYDRLGPDRVVLGGFELTAPPPGTPKPSSPTPVIPKPAARKSSTRPVKGP
jgi:hypothetical protein